MLAGILGVAGPNPPLGWTAAHPPLSLVSMANDRPAVAPAMAQAGYNPASPLPPPTSLASLDWARFTNLTGLVAGVTTLGDELSLLYSVADVLGSAFAARLVSPRLPSSPLPQLSCAPIGGEAPEATCRPGGPSVLAYVFWHWKQSPIGSDEYETRQRAFHAALAAAPPSGFEGSFSVGPLRAPWAGGGAEAYEDWYMVSDFAALGRLNEAAITASRQAPHDAAAALAAGGAGAVYAIRLGTALREPRYAHWFGKPDGISYADFFGSVAPLVERTGSALWMRQMVLGPALEFCLHAREPVSLPAPFRALMLPLRRIWPDPRDAGAG